MAFRAFNALPAKALDDAKTVARSAKNFAQQKSAAYASGSSAEDVLQLRASFVRLDDELSAAAATPGIGEYAADQENDQSYDVAQEFADLRAAIQAVVDHIETAVPKDVDGFLLTRKFAASGQYEHQQFTAQQLATLRGLLDAVVASVE